MKKSKKAPPKKSAAKAPPAKKPLPLPVGADPMQSAMMGFGGKPFAASHKFTGKRH